jgi:hypothetical protein
MHHPLSAKIGTNFAGSGGRSVGIVRMTTKSHRVCFFVLFLFLSIWHYTVSDPASQIDHDEDLELSITNSMERSPERESPKASPTQEIINVLWKPNVHYRVHKRMPRVLAVSQINAAYCYHRNYEEYNLLRCYAAWLL